jgi:WS/DGAT/MGAT family acyltransferase
MGTITPVRQLSGTDAGFLFFESSHTPLHIGSLVIYDQSAAPGGHVRFKDILAHFEGRLRFAACFRQRLVEVPLGLDRPWWIEDPEFDLEYHVRHIALPAPGDWRQLCIQTARLLSRPLDMDRPLWEVTVIEGLNAVEGYPAGAFALVTKIHHAAIDGVSGAEIFAAVHDLAPNEGRPGTDTWEPETPPSPAELLVRAAWHNAVRPLRVPSILMRSKPVLETLGAALPNPLRPATESSRVPVTRFQRRVSAHRVVDGTSFSLADVKAVRQRVAGATVNDVMLTVVGGALRRYLDARGELPLETLVAMAPISIRPETQRNAGGNQISAMFPKLGTHLADPLGRLAFVRESTASSKEVSAALDAGLLTDYANYGPMRLAGLAARTYGRTTLLERAGLWFNTIVTNVPGPQVPLWMGSSRVLALYGLGPLIDGVGLFHTIFSYDGGITVMATSCREIMPDPEVYAACLRHSFAELHTAALAPTTSTPTRSTRRRRTASR